MVLVGCSHHLKTESRLLVQCELACVTVCTMYVLRNPNSLPASRGRPTFLVMFVLGVSVCHSAEWSGHLEALTLLV